MRPTLRWKRRFWGREVALFLRKQQQMLVCVDWSDGVFFAPFATVWCTAQGGLSFDGRHTFSTEAEACVFAIRRLLDTHGFNGGGNARDRRKLRRQLLRLPPPTVR